MSIQALRERKNALVTQARKQLADKGDRTWTKEDQAAYDAVGDEIELLNKQIDAHQKEIDREAQNIIKPADKQEKGPEDRSRAIMDKWMRRGENAISDEEWAHIRNTMSTTTPSEGGYTVQTTTAKQIIEAIKTFGGMRRVAEVFATSQGNAMQYSTSDGTAETGEIIGENTTATDADTSFGTVGLPVYKFSSKVITVPIELLQDSEVDIMAFVQARLRTRLGRIQNTKFTVGTGTNEPRGLVTAIGIGKQGTTGQTTSIIYDDLVDLQESIDDGYADGGALNWMMHQQSRRIIRKIKDTTGRPIWTPGYEYGITKGSPDELLGRPVVINNDMPVMAASAKSLAYGDFTYYKIRDAMDITLFRFTDSAYAKKGQVGFLAWMRSGGNWTDVGGAAKAYQNSAT
ncbi:MAG: phage major capsid protein [Aquabacterium sp.]|uniref:phage major capsid protein n=1 Tax=Aquabacterium sp. TaxID=1872578 RepID=UPI00121F8657|nr:phage major capsid protein [Aquabacterium sp.]TAK84518.1 MAG: phage major capsid protein [Aquabacterium sp.]